MKVKEFLGAHKTKDYRFEKKKEAIINLEVSMRNIKNMVLGLGASLTSNFKSVNTFLTAEQQLLPFQKISQTNLTRFMTKHVLFELRQFKFQILWVHSKTF